MKQLLFLFLLLPAVAGAKSLYWEPPTTRVDGTALPLAEIQHFDLCASRVAGCVQGPVILEAGPDWNSVPIEAFDLPPGTWYFTIRTVDTDGLVSEWADPVSHTIVAPPSPPTALQIE